MATQKMAQKESSSHYLDAVLEATAPKEEKKVEEVKPVV